MDRVFNLLPGGPAINNGLGFMARSIIVSNPTALWWTISGVQVPPYIVNFVRVLESGTQNARIVAMAPGGVTQGAILPLESGQVQYVEDERVATPGIAVSPNAPPSGLFVAAIGAATVGVGNIAFNVPVGAQAGDILIAFAGTRNAGAAVIPALTAITAGWTQLAGQGGAANGAATQALAQFAALASFGTAPLVMTFTAASTETVGIMLALRNASPVVAGTTAISAINPAVAIVLAGAAGAAPGQLAFYQTVATATVPVLAGTAPALVMDVLDVQPGTILLEVGHAVLTAGGNGPQETFTFSGAGFSVMALGRSHNIAHV